MLVRFDYIKAFPFGFIRKYKKAALLFATPLFMQPLHCTLNLVRTEASGTCVHMARSTVHNGLDPLNVGLPGTVGTSVRVGDLDTKGNALTTIITLRHSLHLLSDDVS